MKSTMFSVISAMKKENYSVRQKFYANDKVENKTRPDTNMTIKL